FPPVLWMSLGIASSSGKRDDGDGDPERIETVLPFAHANLRGQAVLDEEQPASRSQDAADFLECGANIRIECVAGFRKPSGAARACESKDISELTLTSAQLARLGRPCQWEGRLFPSCVEAPEPLRQEGERCQGDGS